MRIYMTGSFLYKKIILIAALICFCVAGFFPIHTAQAYQPTAAGLQQQIDSGQMKKAGEKANPPAIGSSGENEDIFCVKWNLDFSLTGCVARGAYIILGAASWVLWLSAILFNATINYTLNMASFIKDIPIVAVGWTTFRDVTNLMFVFIILYIAINTIVGNEGYGIKKLLGKVIITAMLINFSLFFTQAMIDASNIFALQFYHKIVQDSKGADGKATSNVAALQSLNDLDSGISAAFVNGLGLQEVWGIGKAVATQSGDKALDPSDPSAQNLKLNAGNLIIVGLGGTVLVLITAFIFFAATWMFLARTVTLMFLMIMSPLAFMGNTLPALGKYTSDWWSKLFNNLLFAPVYMALLYLVIHMITKGGFAGVGGKKASLYQLFNGNSNMIAGALTFFVLNALMVGCLIIAAKLGVEGGKWAEKTGKDMAKSLGMNLSGANAVRWASIGAARGTVGKVGDRISGSSFLANRAANGGFSGRLAAITMQRADKLKDAKVGGQSFNEQVKKEQADYTKRGNLIEKAILSEVGEQRTGEKDAEYKKRKQDAATAARTAEGKYLSGSRISYASKQAIKKAKKASEGTDNKEALQNLLSDKFSQDKHNEAKKLIEEDHTDAQGNPVESLNTQIARIRTAAKQPGARNLPALNAQLSILLAEKKEYQDIIDGHLRTVEKLSNLESK